MEKESLSILVIDPERSDHELIRQSLLRSKVPAKVHFTMNTADGLAFIAKNELDLVLTDHALPAANAFHLLFEIQQKEISLPVLLLTRNREARIAREAFHRGVGDYILKEELEIVSLFDIIGNIIEKHREREARDVRENHLRELAERDGLTGLFNHRYFVESIEKEFERSKRYRRNFSLVMIDLDGFKAINDTCGHPQGDEVIRQIARLLMQSVRFIDVAARYGGDEFALLLPETNLNEAQKTAARILQEIRNAPYLYNGKVFPLSASVGIAAYHLGMTSPGDVIKEADQALYAAKRSGRDRIVVSKSLKSKGSRGNEPAEVPVGVVEVRHDVK